MKRSFGSGLVLGVLLAALALVVAYSFWGKTVPEQLPEAPIEESQPYLALKGENILLKKMLGQVESEVILLGPVRSGSVTHGKLVWDKALQQGFLYIDELPEREGQFVLVFGEGEGRVKMGSFHKPEGLKDISVSFRAEKPVFKFTRIEVMIPVPLSEGGKDSMVPILRGVR